MNILFISLMDFSSFEEENIYTDLLNEFMVNGHKVIAISPLEHDSKKKTEVIEYGVNKIIKPQIYPIKKQKFIKKGLNTIFFPKVLLSRIEGELDVEKIDWVIYPTPPTSLTPVIRKIKKINPKIKSYLLLKDIFPQNAIDLKIMKKGLIYYYFRRQEQELYRLSDLIGCMSPKNCQYVLSHNQFLVEKKVNIIPNSISASRVNDLSSISTPELRKKWKIPLDKKIYVYSGNFGLPQNIDFLINNISELLSYDSKIHFVFCGSGMEDYKIKKFSQENPKISTYLGHLTKKESDEVVALSDFALVLLSPRFTIPNIPSRLLTYFKYSKPILAATDVNTDVRELIEYNNIGFWKESVDYNLKKMVLKTLDIDDEEYSCMSNNSRRMLEEKFNVEKVYEKMIEEMREI